MGVAVQGSRETQEQGAPVLGSDPGDHRKAVEYAQQASGEEDEQVVRDWVLGSYRARDREQEEAITSWVQEGLRAGTISESPGRPRRVAQIFAIA